MWVWYSLFFAFWSSIGAVLVKNLSKKIKPLPLLYAVFLFNVPASFILLFFVGGIPKVTTDFYIFISIAAILDVIALSSYFVAINQTAISILFPISSFSVIFTTIIAAFTLHEVPTGIKFIGILLVVIGAYLLNIADIKGGIMKPFKLLFSNKGVLLFLLSNLIWSITPIFQKKAIFETSPQVPLFPSFFGMLLVLLILTPFAIKKAIASFKEISSNVKWFAFNGIGTAFAQAAAFAAFSLTYLGYATAVFRLSTLFIIIFGGVFLKEERIKERLLGGSVMVLGTTLLAM